MKHWHSLEEVRRALELYATGLNAQQVAKIVDSGSSKKWVLDALKKYGASRTNHETHRMNDPSWGSGKFIRDGYAFVQLPTHPKADSRGFVREHFLVWEDAHPDDPILPGQIIRHKNRNGLDNRPENLEKMPRGRLRQYSPRGNYRSGRNIVAGVGESLAVRLGIKLNPIDLGPDGTLNGAKVEVKTRRLCPRTTGWTFLTDKQEAEMYLFVGLGRSLIPASVWLIPAKQLAGRKSVYLSPRERRTRGDDSWHTFRIDIEKIVAPIRSIRASLEAPFILGLASDSK